MPVGSARPADPCKGDFAGDSAARIARRLFHATRPKFFPASLLPVFAGTAWGVYVSGSFDSVLFVLALVATLSVHAGANVLNDVGDDAGGTDRLNKDRVYPYTGGSRFIQNGIMEAPVMARLGISLLMVAAVAGLLLLTMKGPMILAFGLAGVALAVLYSLGPLHLASTGLGELAVAAGFGLIPVCGAAWLQGGVLDGAAVLFSLPVSAWVAAVLLINEVPDIAADAATGKRTLPVRLGIRATAILYASIQLIALAACVRMTSSGQLPLLAPLVPAGLLLPGLKAAAAIRRGPAERETMRKAIEMTLGIHTLGTAWLTGIALYLVFVPA